MISLLRSSSRRIVCCSSNATFRFVSFEVGSPIPINFMKDSPDPVIKPDDEYPEWLFSLTEPLPTKRELVEMIEKDGMEAVSTRHLKLTKRRLTKEQIKENNLTGGI
mmetsp:Transcript_4365/g.7455  ORF Transcript_4365/g.7455 Transcript_4365/m.7455 type:complete len:107 (+) Transcript_4365:93-413(+)